jgi:hypothetical protein
MSPTSYQAAPPRGSISKVKTPEGESSVVILSERSYFLTESLGAAKR